MDDTKKPYIPPGLDRKTRKDLETLSPYAGVEGMQELILKFILFKNRDAGVLRQYIEGSFFAGRPLSLGWHHMKFTLLANDRPLMEALAPHVTPPDARDMGDLLKTMRERSSGTGITITAAHRGEDGKLVHTSAEELALREYEYHRRLLRRLGFRHLPEAEENPPLANPSLEERVCMDFVHGDRYGDFRLKFLRHEWLKVLDAARGPGDAPEAVIAGGALFNQFQGADVSSVDIFLRLRENRRGGRVHRGMLKKIFAAAAVEVQESQGYSDRWIPYTNPDVFPVVKFPAPAVTGVFRPPEAAGMTDTESFNIRWDNMVHRWPVQAKGGTEYVFHFLPGRMGGEMHHRGEGQVAPRLLHIFHVSATRIATDGQTIYATPEYRADVAAKKFVLHGEPGGLTRRHLESLSKKYPDWTLCKASQKLLERKP